MRTLDVRPVPTWKRHAQIFAAFSELEESAGLTLVVDHEPRPLRLQFEQRYPNAFVWDQRLVGCGRWEVRLQRFAPANGAGGHIPFFRRCPLFCGTNDEALRSFDQHARVHSLRRGTSVVDQDTQWPYLGVVKTGLLSAIIDATSGREHSVLDFLPCDTFGDIETVDGGRSFARVTVTSDAAEVVLIPRGIVLSALAADIHFSQRIAQVCAQRVRFIGARLATYVGYSAVSRIAAALLPYAVPDVGLAPTLEPLQRMTQSQLAVIAGTAKEVAARAIAELEAAGALRRTQGHISHIDRAQLQTYVADE